MRRLNWIAAAACLAVICASSVQAKGPHRAWHKRAKSTKTAKHYGSVYAPLPFDAPMHPGVPTPVDEIPEVVLPERLPQAPTIEDSSARTDSIRERWDERYQRIAERRTQVRQERAERLRALAAGSDRSTTGRSNSRIDREAFPVIQPDAIANAPPRAEAARRRNRFDGVTPQPVEARRPIADRFDLRRQDAGPAFPNEAPRFQPGGEVSPLSAPPTASEDANLSSRVREWWSRR